MDPTAERSLARVRERIADDAPVVAGDDVLCPFCRRPLTVRRSVLGQLPEVADGRRPHIDGVQLKCAGDDGCGFRPDFDVPVTSTEWVAERARRDGERVYDAGYDPENGESVADRLRALGYLPGE